MDLGLGWFDLEAVCKHPHQDAVILKLYWGFKSLL